jgi:hypothetical protein
VMHECQALQGRIVIRTIGNDRLQFGCGLGEPPRLLVFDRLAKYVRLHGRARRPNLVKEQYYKAAIARKQLSAPRIQTDTGPGWSL